MKKRYISLILLLVLSLFLSACSPEFIDDDRELEKDEIYIDLPQEDKSLDSYHEDVSEKDREFIDGVYIGKDLKIEDEEFDLGDRYMYFSGYVKNTGDKKYSFIKVKVTYYDEDKNIVDTDGTYLVSSKGLGPGERKSFRIMTKYNKEISYGILSIADYVLR